ncbi:IS607 family transposase [Cereibacter sphaeroides]|uniref:IS607 family transposase n=1 Tax=Cereibacter sphaeroides TaxID=1063 RepID=UPI001F247752|nr:IS607 family transposase [Cereibacter sphaeroides]MCE6959594.1 IS607 family transposase [Cereibacter sphaeroides]MCE6974546.1 IS607 family transposase [Cereibacter sphaeroides]
MAHARTDLIRIAEAARLMGVSTSTMARWHTIGQLRADVVTPGGDRRWSRSRLEAMRGDVPTVSDRKTIAYARVSTAEQRDDLQRQQSMLEQFCAARGWIVEIIADTGSGMNYRKRGLQRLLDLLLEDKVERLVLTHRDRLLRFGAELVFAICEKQGVEVVVICAGDEAADGGFEQELARDVLEIVSVFSARLYGARSRKNRKLLEDMRAAARVAAESDAAA